MTDVRDMFASVFFVDSITVADLKERYARAMRGGSRVRVLIVPGHDDRAWGTEFRGIREADMNAMVGEELSKFLSGDAAYEPILVRTSEGYVKEFQDYFDSEQKNVLEFLTEKKKIMRNLVRAGSVHTIDGVVHNSVPSEIAGRLYAINKWANEHAVDIVIHIHFNDYPGRPHTRPGRYNGFSLYVADPQFSNAKASKAVAGSLFEQLSKFYAESNLPVEDSGIVEDQELIAIGAYNTVDPASVLIEYGYIYEQQFLDSDIRAKVMRELAFQTYQGLNRFFGKYGELFQEYPTTLLPHAWERPLVQGSGANTEILSLQAALLLEDLYPPQGESKRDCPLTGSFGPCTARAVKLFQEKNGLPTSGTVGELTLAKLNEKYGR
ncbi:MAG: N-acetylmuramoyl-L-alanine amidase [bacterium]|nr:N-acetylmuramoyl-L-alanine amidase [bacterium]